MTKRTSVSSASNKNNKHETSPSRSQVGKLINRADLEAIAGGADWRLPAPTTRPQSGDDKAARVTWGGEFIHTAPTPTAAADNE